MPRQTAVVFAYSQVGVRCLSALLTQDLQVDLVVTHEDSDKENIWFESVAELAALNNIATLTPRDPNSDEFVGQIVELKPDWIFAFYYRYLLCDELLAAASRGALNMHGSLLPQYRGRAPTNWAVLKGETLTGATLHRMIARPDAGEIVDQEPCVILPNDTAQLVMQRVCCAAEVVLLRAVPKLLDGTAGSIPNDQKKGSYFGGRRPEDGRISSTMSAFQIHNLIRAVAPPYPGAFFDVGDCRLRFLGSYWAGEAAGATVPRIYIEKGRLYLDCCDGNRLQITWLETGGKTMTEKSFRQMIGDEILLEEMP